MGYKIKVVKNGTETYEDTLHMTNMLGSIMNNALYPQFITPFSDTYAKACLLFSDTLEKRNDNVDVFGATLLGGNTYSNGSWTVSGVSGHVGSICFSHQDTLNHWDDNNYLTEGGIAGNSDDQIYFVDPDEKCFYTLTNTSYNNSDMLLKKFKIKEPKIKLFGWTHTTINKTYPETCTVENTGLVPGTLFKNDYYYSTTFGNTAKSKSEILYGTFHGHSITQNDRYLIGFNYYKYNIIPNDSYTGGGNSFTFAEDITVESHSYVEIVLIDKRTFSYTQYILNDVDNDNSTTIKAGTYEKLTEFHDAGDIIQMKANAADDNYIYIVGKYYDESGTEQYNIYTLPISGLKDGLQLTFYSIYDASICHTINRKNAFYQGAWDSYANDFMKLGRKDGVNCFTGIFKAGMAAISNFNFDITASDTLVITVEMEE